LGNKDGRALARLSECRRVDVLWAGGGGEGYDVNECLRDGGAETVWSSYVREDVSECMGDNSMVGRRGRRRCGRTHAEEQSSETGERTRYIPSGSPAQKKRSMRKDDEVTIYGAGFSTSD
jgi:hypothetical protein